MRVNGRATISTSPELIEAFTVDGKSPKTVVEVKVERVYFQCSKALVRSGIWDSHIAQSFGDVPSAGEMLAATSTDSFDAREYDRMLEKRYTDELW
jgi:predicted pyridoxine 5'-phosphate oxidase superfamily flavin-nucleotide-binding protein